jgi:hypothetical protein
MGIYLPPRVAAEENKRFAADVFRNVTVEDPRAREFTSKLKQVHPDLWMVRAHNTVDSDVPLRPGFYHVLKVNDPAVAPLSVFVVHDGNHNYCEPTGAVFERLAEGDLSQRRVRDRIAEHDRVVQEAVDRRTARATTRAARSCASG